MGQKGEREGEHGASGKEDLQVCLNGWGAVSNAGREVKRTGCETGSSATTCVWLSRSVVSDFCDPIVCHLAGSCVHGVLQARMLEWVAMKEYATDHTIYI